MLPIDISGQRFGRLVAIEWTGRSVHGKRVWSCRCDCGNFNNVPVGSLRSGHIRSCGCLQGDVAAQRNRAVALDLTGRRYGRLLVMEWTGRSDRGNRVWRCVCDCGEGVEATTSNLRGGNTQSCGCLKREVLVARNLTHGFRASRRYHPLYHAWQGAHQRCENPNDAKYDRYGERGIMVCARWSGPEGFANFVEDMGPKPSPAYSLDRVNNDGDYEPDNCRWATARQQSRNRDSTKWKQVAMALKAELAQAREELAWYRARYGPLE